MRALPSFAEVLPEFDPATASDEPEPLFLAWLDEAVLAGVLAPHAATLATVDAAGPSARVLILKDVGPGVWAIATPADSRPGQAMAASGQAALSFFWPALGRQVRVEGAVQRADAEEAARDFLARPAAARATALVGRPEPTLPGDDAYERARARALERVERDPGSVPPSWALWHIEAQSVEFWQASHDRVHVRLRYRRDAGVWVRERLWP